MFAYTNTRFPSRAAADKIGVEFGVEKTCYLL